MDEIDDALYSYDHRCGKRPTGIYLGNKEFAELKRFGEVPFIQYGTAENEPDKVAGLTIHRTFNESDLEVF